MRTLEDHTLIYDDECPMCDLYTRSFVKLGMLDSQGRQTFTQASTTGKGLEDTSRARDEIALVNRTTGETVYGLDSLLKIIGFRLPLVQRLSRSRAFYGVMKHLYSFISFNRKEIIPGKVFERPDACTPTFNLRYRVAYICLTWFVSAFLFHRYTATFDSGTPGREVMIVGGQLMVQGCLVWFLKPGRVFHYLGNLMTVYLGGSLLLLIGAVSLLRFPAVAHIGYFSFVAFLMFIEHARRVRHLEISSIAIWSWTAYWLVARLLF